VPTSALPGPEPDRRLRLGPDGGVIGRPNLLLQPAGGDLGQPRDPRAGEPVVGIGHREGDGSGNFIATPHRLKGRDKQLAVPGSRALNMHPMNSEKSGA